MPRLVSALLVRDEAGPDRFLRRVLGRCREFSDEIVVVDDSSTDDTPALCREYGAHVTERSLAVPAWGAEAPARAILWDAACQYARQDTDWVLVCDADQILVGDPRPLTRSVECNAWSFVLYDCWSATEYREDEYWRAHMVPRPWLFAPHRVPSGWTPTWSQRGMHTGHCPSNFPMASFIAPPDTYHWLHLGYSTSALRTAKAAAYAAVAHQLTPFEQAHAKSILTPC